jgi:hypothetical protein
MEIKKITYKEEGQTKKVGRPKKTRTLISQSDLILSILQHNTNHDGTYRNSFTELELTRVIGSYNLRSYDDSNKWNERGARAIISTLRNEGYPIASENVINPNTDRVNKAYYLEMNEVKYWQWHRKNSETKFKKGAPK